MEARSREPHGDNGSVHCDYVPKYTRLAQDIPNANSGKTYQLTFDSVEIARCCNHMFTAAAKELRWAVNFVTPQTNLEVYVGEHAVHSCGIYKVRYGRFLLNLISDAAYEYSTNAGSIDQIQAGGKEHLVKVKLLFNCLKYSRLGSFTTFGTFNDNVELEWYPQKFIEAAFYFISLYLKDYGTSFDDSKCLEMTSRHRLNAVSQRIRRMQGGALATGHQQQMQGAAAATAAAAAAALAATLARRRLGLSGAAQA